MADIENKEETSPQSKGYRRFSILHRIEHWIFMASFATLGMTGLIQRFSSLSISVAIVGALGGIENTRLIHHIAAIIMGVVTVYHIGAVAYRMYVERTRLSMLPGLQDIKAAIHTLMFNIKLRTTPPQQGRYTFEEKLEYWAVVWGTIVMGVTGFLMWNPVATTRILPGEVIPAAKMAHGLEAILAVLAIIVWHFYNVLIRTFNRSMFTGQLTEEQMLHEHPLELADIKAGIAKRPVAPQTKKKRERIFWPSYGVMGAFLLVGIYWFVTFEQTAITTIPPAEEVQVFSPLTPTPLPTMRPTATPAPIEAITWSGGIGDLFQTKCGGCHNPSAKIAGLDMTNYGAALTGGSSGPGIIPGDPDNSQVVIIQSPGGHPGQLTIDELELVIEWILSGALED